MKKKYVLLASLCIFTSMVSIKAEAKNIRVSLPKFNITINDNLINTKNAKYPLIVYKDITYFPMTYYDMRLLGVETQWKGDDQGLFIEKSDIDGSYVPITDTLNGNIQSATIPNFPITINGKVIDNSKEEYPLLSFRDVTYFPLTWKYAVEEFGWEYNFDANSGLVIRSSKGTSTSETVINSDNVAIDAPYYYFAEANKVYSGKINSKEKPKEIFSLTDKYKGLSLTSTGGITYLSYRPDASSAKGPYYHATLKDGEVYKVHDSNNIEVHYKNGKEYLISYLQNGFSIKTEDKSRNINIKDYNLSDFYEYNNSLFMILTDKSRGTKKALYSLDEKDNLKLLSELGDDVFSYVQWDGSNMYYVKNNKGKYTIYQYNLETNETKEIQSYSNLSDGWEFRVLNGHIFLRSAETNYSLSVDGKPLNERAEMGNFEILNDFLVATFMEKPENKYRLMVIDKEGNIVYKSADITDINSLSIKDDTLYYFNLNSKKIVSSKLN
ncbi:hypothetical protein [Anaerosphaera multitolerans]|uniref:DUF5050 domain-containing protein n=1 Tax=Anaerosphaera multitolerans TaxID=2487351 RepID=A0A437S8B1_9FIRM|nr:hypothetical protein [Anaerosphaera multitolerans]RVU55144.1 hypothetical protein EF514_04450 [Anaerosphaera multitolerans]